MPEEEIKQEIEKELENMTREEKNLRYKISSIYLNMYHPPEPKSFYTFKIDPRKHPCFKAEAFFIWDAILIYQEEGDEEDNFERFATFDWIINSVFFDILTYDLRELASYLERNNMLKIIEEDNGNDTYYISKDHLGHSLEIKSGETKLKELTKKQVDRLRKRINKLKFG